MTQRTLDLAQKLPEQSFGEKGKRAWFWQDNQWQVGSAWAVKADGAVLGMCRDYGVWGIAYGGREPTQTHGTWPFWQVRFKRPSDQYAGPVRETA